MTCSPLSSPPQYSRAPGDATGSTHVLLSLWRSQLWKQPRESLSPASLEQGQTTTWRPECLIFSPTDSQVPPFLAKDPMPCDPLDSQNIEHGTAPPVLLEQTTALLSSHQHPPNSIKTQMAFKVTGYFSPQLLISGLDALNLKSIESNLVRARSVCLMPAQWVCQPSGSCLGCYRQSQPLTTVTKTH